jgi:hypothetical protein
VRNIKSGTCTIYFTTGSLFRTCTGRFTRGASYWRVKPRAVFVSPPYFTTATLILFAVKATPRLRRSAPGAFPPPDSRASGPGPDRPG